MIFTLSVVLMTVTSLLSLQVWSFLRSRASDSRSARLMGWLMIDCSIWAAFNTLELIGTDFWFVWAMSNLRYIAITTLPVVWFRFGIHLMRGDDDSRARLKEWESLYWVIPLITALLIWTDPWLGWVRGNLRLEPREGFVELAKDYAPWFWVHSLYSYVLIVIGTVQVVRSMVRRSDNGPMQAAILAGSALVPTAANLLYLAGLWPLQGVDPTPIAFALTGLLFVLALSRFRFLAVLPAAQDAVIAGLEQIVLIFDLRERLVFLNKAAAKVFQLTRLEAGQSMTALSRTNRALRALPPLADLGSETHSAEVTLPGPAGDFRYEVHLSRVRRNESDIAFVYIGHDVTLRARTQLELEAQVAVRTRELQDSHRQISDELERRKETEKQLFHFSLHDPLTGLPNRSLLLNRLEQTLARFRREPQHLFALLFIDFDNFKLLNDSYGHAAGDTLLRESSSRLLAAVRAVDTVSRLGGDEFVVLLDHVKTPEEALDVADRIANDLTVPIHHGQNVLLPSTSMGVLAARPGYSHPEELLRDSDMAMYHAKGLGKNRRAMFDESMRTEVQERTRITHELRRAILEGHIDVHYQPIVRLSDGEAVGCEALARWTHSELGRIGPDRFIPVAEESGLIAPLGLVVLRESCRAAALLAREFPGRPLFISVNVSPLQLTQPDFAEVLESCLNEHNLEPAALHLEITESALVQGPDVVQSLLQRLVDRGFKFKLDDFGTGYSSLAYLHRFPIQTIKIDRSFVQDLDDPAERILKGIVSLGHELGKDLVAEGIETEDQAGLLKSWACDYGQGYLFGRPVPLEQWLKTLVD